MKKTIKLAVVAALALGTTSAFATNGSNLIGTGAKARAMGGATIGIAQGAESGLSNGALITSIDGTEIAFGGTLFMPKVSTNFGAGATDSEADMSMIPEVSIATKISDNFYAGIGMWGTAGMGVDYRVDPNVMRMVTNLQLMQFGVPLAYKMNDFSLAITPVLQYGSLDINYNNGANVGAGVAQDLAFGFNFGASYEIAGVTIGAIYKSEIEMEYKGQLSNALQNFGATTYTNDTLSTPAEIGIGASYKINEHTIALDYKQIAWSSAAGYEDFEWEDQDVISIGYEYATDGWAARIGYNYAASPISEQSLAGGLNAAGISYAAINALNLSGFPAIVESHITLGGSYTLNKQTSVDLAYVYAPEVTESYASHNGVNPFTVTTTHSQTSLSAAVNFNF